MTKQMKSFIFNGVLARHAVSDMEAAGLLQIKSAVGVNRSDTDLLASVPERIRSGAIQMQRAYKFLFHTENIVRELIVSKFSEIDGEQWFEKRASVAMKQKVVNRRDQEAKNQWHSGRNREDIYFLDFGDLAKIITNAWSDFEDLLPSQAWVQSRMDEAERSRNVIAHTNLLASEEVERLEMYLRDWIKQIG